MHHSAQSNGSWNISCILVISKLSCKNVNWTEPVNVNRYIETTWILKKLHEDGWELIYFDGIGFDTRKSQFYGWSPIGDKGYIKLHQDQIDMTFVCAISKLCFYGVMGVKGTTDGQCIVKFIRQLWEFRKTKHELNDTKFILVSDNASVNICQEVSEFISSSKLRMMTINPYSPAANPAEKVINCIKTKLRKIQSWGK